MKRFRAPLSEKHLIDVARLYGAADPKYRSIEFCRHMFNENPAGFSWHIFVEDDGQTVGHYGLVPLTVKRGSRLLLSAKGEAFFIAETHRGQKIQIGDTSYFLAIAMLKESARFAQEEGCELIHVCVSDMIGVMYKNAGYRFVKAHHGEWVYLLASPHGAPLAMRIAFLALELFQFITMRVLELFTRISGWNAAAFAQMGLPSKAEAALVPQGSNTSEKWKIDDSVRYRSWLAGFGFLSTLESGASSVLVCVPLVEGGTMEIVSWEGSSRLVEWAGVVGLLLHLARESGASSLHISRSIIPAEKRDILLRFLGFLLKNRKLNLFVQSPDPFYRNPEHVDFTPWFHATF